MTEELVRAAHAVLLPAFDGWDIDAVMGPFLAGGGRAVLVGESRAEYLDRRMSPARRAVETAEFVRERIARLRDLAGSREGDLIVAVDEELGGIRRLAGLVPDLPDAEEARRLSDVEIEARCFANAAAARELGITMYLAPILDVVDGDNPWLRGRTLATDPHEVARIGAAFVRGVQRAGLIAVAKHFPGFNHLPADPAVTDVALETGLDALMANARPFAAAIAAGVRAVMPGPARVSALDADKAACVSPAVIGLLRQRFGFDGLIVTDDLDAPATLRGRSLLDTAIDALAAGGDLLLVAGGSHLEELCEGIARAAADGRLPRTRLEQAAGRVRAVAGA